MPRNIVLGNGKVLVCMDKFAQIRDFYFPYVGQENHVEGHRHKIGVWTDKKFSWLFEKGWSLEIKYRKETLISEIKAVNKDLGIELFMMDTVHNEKDIYIKKIMLKNLSSNSREIRIFLNQHFHIAGANIGDTVYFDPRYNAVVYYKGRRYFFISGLHRGKGISDYATGIADYRGLEGTYKDAEDGLLSKNPIEHGSVDSTISFSIKARANSNEVIYYWIAVGRKFKDVCLLNEFILKKNPEALINESSTYWKNWVNKTRFNFYGLNQEIIELFKRSLLIIRSQIDNRGAIIAANDSDILQSTKDTYSYMWPRDGALVAMALDRAGYIDITRNFFLFCNDVLTDSGFLLHKYRPDKSLGSSWHSWVKNGNLQLPIQEDETALVLYSLWNHYERYKDFEFVNSLYDTFIKKAADFLYDYRDEKMKLPKESYDLWEEKLGISTFTCSSVYAGLVSCAKFAKLFGNIEDFKKYENASIEVRRAIIDILYDKDRKRFLKMLNTLDDGTFVRDNTVDISSVYGIINFNVLKANDEMVLNSINAVEEKLMCNSKIGGIARYEADQYHRISDDIKKVPGNPWFITYLWLADYYIMKANSKNDLVKAVEIMDWVNKRALPTGVLAEQIDPYSGEPISVSPLTWSHATFVLTVLRYLDKLEELGICKACSVSSVL